MCFPLLEAYETGCFCWIEGVLKTMKEKKYFKAYGYSYMVDIKAANVKCYVCDVKLSHLGKYAFFDRFISSE